MRQLLFIIFSYIFGLSLKAQPDTTYIRTFSQEFTIRPYIYKKFTSLTTKEGGSDRMTYSPNTPVGLGIGFTYKDYALNLAYAPPVFRDEKMGKTKYIDLQYHYYHRKYIFDFFFQDYKGFYHVINSKREEYGLYPDIQIVQYGASAHYLFNHKKFSYKASFYCNEKQVKSAGSFQLGGGFYFNKLLSDTTQILRDKNNFKNYQLSITGGYIYTWVIKHDFFLTIGLTAGINLGIENIKKFDTYVEVTPNIFPRVSMGYNGKDWAIYMNSILNQVYVTKANKMDVTLNTGRVTLCYVKRLSWSPGFLKKIKPLNR